MPASVFVIDVDAAHTAAVDIAARAVALTRDTLALVSDLPMPHCFTGAATGPTDAPAYAIAFMPSDFSEVPVRLVWNAALLGALRQNLLHELSAFLLDDHGVALPALVGLARESAERVSTNALGTIAAVCTSALAPTGASPTAVAAHNQMVADLKNGPGRDAARYRVLTDRLNQSKSALAAHPAACFTAAELAQRLAAAVRDDLVALIPTLEQWRASAPRSADQVAVAAPQGADQSTAPSSADPAAVRARRAGL